MSVQVDPPETLEEESRAAPAPAGPDPRRGRSPTPAWFPARRVARLRARQRRRWLWTVTAAVLAFFLLAVVLLSGRKGNPAATAPVPKTDSPAPPSIAWAVEFGQAGALVVIGVPADRPPVAMLIPGATIIDLPAGEPPTVDLASVSAGGALSAAQGALDRRVGHYLVSTLDDVAALVDRLGGIQVLTESTFVYLGAQRGPGTLTMKGAQVVAYLRTGTGVDRGVRWEDVVAGLLQAAPNPDAWSTPPGMTDEAIAVSQLLLSAHEAAVIEMPTAPVVGGGVQPDQAAVAKLLSARFGTSLGPLVRVIVQNGNGRPGQGAAVGELLAIAGFRVVASQNASSFDVAVTKVIAKDSRYVSLAQEAQRLLGAGRVYVGSQPTGISDITIIVGRDFTSG